MPETTAPPNADAPENVTPTRGTTEPSSAGSARQSEADGASQSLDLDTIQARAEAATPGPWSGDETGTVCADADLEPDGKGGEILPEDGPMEVTECYRCERPGERARNAAFIAAARSDVPALLAEVKRLTAMHADAVDGSVALGWELVGAEAERDEAHDELASLRQDLELQTTAAFTNQAESSRLAREVEDLEAERDQLRYERRLLGAARMVLDRQAEYPNLHQVDRDELAAEAGDVAQRIVDEIGHPGTDEPALGPSFREQIAALTVEVAEANAVVGATRQSAIDAFDALRVQLLAALDRKDDGRTPLSEYVTALAADRDRMRPVVEAARVVVGGWREEPSVAGTGWISDEANSLASAVAAFEAGTPAAPVPDQRAAVLAEVDDLLRSPRCNCASMTPDAHRGGCVYWRYNAYRLDMVADYIAAATSAPPASPSVPEGEDR